MADKEISALPAATVIDGSELVHVVQGGNSRKSAISLIAREKLTANRTYYVRSDGNDNNTGLVDSAGGAFLTIQKALNARAAIDGGTFDVTIQVADGTYTGAISVVGPWLGSGNVSIVGNITTPANVVISVTSNNAIAASAGGRLRVRGVKIQTITSGVGVMTDSNGLVTFNGIFEMGACATYHMLAQNGGIIHIASNYTISGGSLYHWIANGTGMIFAVGITVTLTGTPAFSQQFAYASRGASIQCHLNTFSGAATGQRFLVDSGGSIFTNNAGPTYLPGNAPGSIQPGSVYDGNVATRVPVTKTADFTWAETEDSIINNKAGSACIVTLPAAANYPGRRLRAKNIIGQALTSVSANVCPLGSATPGTTILSGNAGRWAFLESDGTNWIIMAGVI